jgi:hypothetical protein
VAGVVAIDRQGLDQPAGDSTGKLHGRRNPEPLQLLGEVAGSPSPLKGRLGSLERQRQRSCRVERVTPVADLPDDALRVRRAPRGTHGSRETARASNAGPTWRA